MTSSNDETETVFMKPSVDLWESMVDNYYKIPSTPLHRIQTGKRGGLSLSFDSRG